MNGTLTMEERISKQQLQKIYGVNRKTIEDLLNWEKSHMINS
jgi:hypothetical protein